MFGCNPARFDPFCPIEWIVGYRLPKSGNIEEVGDGAGMLALEEAN